jgi:hypothetical protein
MLINVITIIIYQPSLIDICRPSHTQYPSLLISNVTSISLLKQKQLFAINLNDRCNMNNPSSYSCYDV